MSLTLNAAGLSPASRPDLTSDFFSSAKTRPAVAISAIAGTMKRFMRTPPTVSKTGPASPGRSRNLQGRGPHIVIQTFSQLPRQTSILALNFPPARLFAHALYSLSLRERVGLRVSPPAPPAGDLSQA